MTPDEQVAWDADCIERERIEGRIAAHLILWLDIPWLYFDYSLAREWLPLFATIRITMIALSIMTLVALRRSTTLRATRRLNLSLYGILGVLIGIMWPLVEPGAYWAYVVGFSLVLWGTLIFSWPFLHGVILYALALLAAVPAFLLSPVQHEVTLLIGTVFYLLTVVCICLSVLQLRRRLMERAFRASYQLEQRNEDLSHALAALQEAQARMLASEKLSALGRLLAGLSHEINNPINVIANTVVALREYVESLDVVLDAYESSEEQLAAEGEVLAKLREEMDLPFIRQDFPFAIAAIDEAADRIRGIQANLRRFIRGVAPSMREGDFNDGIRVTLTMLERSLPEDVVVRPALSDLPPFVGEFDQLNQVHLNLLQNAVDAVGDAGEIRVETSCREGAIVMVVQDDGPGIPDELGDRVFEPFFTTKEVGQGTGLGLSVCHQIVTAHGGSIELDPKCAKGTRIVIRLPLPSRTPSQRVKAQSAA